MTPEDVSGVEIRGAEESFPADAPALKTLYLVLVVVLGLVLVIGVVAWVLLAFAGVAMPEGLAVIIGAICGGLVGILTSPSSGRSR